MPGPQRVREVRVHVPEVDGEPRVSAGGGGGRRGQAQAQGDQYYSMLCVYLLYLYLHISTLLFFAKCPIQI